MRLRENKSREHALSPEERFAVWLLAVMAFFLFADQNLMAPNLTQIAREFGFTEMERDVKLGGQVSLAFWVIGGAVSLIAGYLTDLWHRKGLLIAIILVGEIPCLLTGFARNFEQLIWLRALTGIGMGGAMPVIYSFLGDYFPAQRRAAASAYMGLAMGLGIAGGQLIAGLLGPEHGWRLPFILVALPNFLLIILFALLVREPRRGQAEEELKELIHQGLDYPGTIHWKQIRSLFRVRTNLFIFIQALFGTVPWGVFFVFLNDFYAQEKGYPVETATLIVMVVGGAAILGGLVGGLLGNRVYNIKHAYLPLFSGLVTLAGIIPTLILINLPAGEARVALPLVFGFLSGLIVAMTGPNIRAMLLNVNPPETRGTIFAVFTLADDVGKGLGPAVISLLILAVGRLLAFNIATLFWLVCGMILLWLVRVYPSDEEQLRLTLKERFPAQHIMHSDRIPTME